MKKRNQTLLTSEQQTLRRNAVIGELNEQCRGGDINHGEWQLFIAQTRTWDGQSREPGLQRFIGLARVQDYYGEQEPPAEKMVEPEKPKTTVKLQETKPLADVNSQDNSPPDKASPPAQPLPARDPGKQEEHDQHTEDEQTVLDNSSDRNPQTSAGSDTTTRTQQQTPQSVQTPRQPEQEQPPHPIEAVINAANGIQVKESPMVNSAKLAKSVLSKTGSLTTNNAQTVTGDNSFRVIKDGNSAIVDQDQAFTEGTKLIMDCDEITDADKKMILDNLEVVQSFEANGSAARKLEDIKRPTFTVDGLFPSRGLVFINGKPKSGKTIIAASIAHACSTGRSFSGRNTEPRPIIFVELEGKPELEVKLVALNRFYGVEFGDLEIYDESLYPGTIEGDAKLRGAILKRIAQKKPRPIVIIDNLSAITTGDENKAVDNDLLMKNINRLKIEYDVLTILVSHSGKDESRGIAGSIKFQAWADLVLDSRKSGDTFTLYPNICRFGSLPALSWELTTVELPATDGYPKSTEALVDYMKIREIEDWRDGLDDSGQVEVFELEKSDQYIFTAISTLNLRGDPSIKENIKDVITGMVGDISDKKVRCKRDRIMGRLAELETVSWLNRDERGAYYVTPRVPVKWKK